MTYSIRKVLAVLKNDREYVAYAHTTISKITQKKMFESAKGRVMAAAKMFKCGCGKSFRRYDGRYNHSSEGLFWCDGCGAEYVWDDLSKKLVMVVKTVFL